MKPEQITAWALDEASAEDRQQLEAALLENPTAKQTAEETKEFCDFLLTELRDDSLAFTEEQRERLKAQPTMPAKRASDRKRALQTNWRTRSGVILAMAAVWVAMGVYWVGEMPEALRDAGMLSRPNRSPGMSMGAGAVAGSAAGPQIAPLPGLPSQIGHGGLPPTPTEYSLPAISRPLLTLKNDVNSMTALDVEELKKIQDGTSLGVAPQPAAIARDVVALQVMQEEAGKNVGLDAVVATERSEALNRSAVAAGGVVMTGVAEAAVMELRDDESAPHPANAPASPQVANPTPAAAVDQVSKGLLLAASSTEIGNYNAAISQYQDVLRSDPYNAAARRGMEAVERKRFEYFKAAADHSRGRLLAQVNEDWEVKAPRSDAYYFGRSPDENELPVARPQLESRSNTETYTRILENELKDVAREPLSTFSIDVDTAAYANVRRFLNQNTIPPADAVRIEELVNYFPTAEEGPAHDAKEPFAVRVEMAPCPWQPVHRLARIAIKGRELGNDRKNSNLVFLVDVSGSMNEPNKLPLVQQSLRMLTEQLGEGDRVTMVVYAGSSGLVLPPTNGEKKQEILAAIDKLKAGGSTHGSAGIQLAYEQAVAGFIKEGVNRVILCTDGDFNVGVSSPEALETLITQKAKSGVFLSVLGFGSGNLKDRTMETLADKGNGNYAYIDSLSEARKVLVEQMSGTLVTIAKDVKIQVEFNPASVRSYRLIGYENRMLAKEDFNDDSKDAGEIGAGHSVVALYEVVPANLPPGAEPRPAVDSLKYQAAAIAPAQLAEAAKSGQTMTVKLRYKAPDGDQSTLIEMPVKDEGKTLTASSDEYKFSAAVAGFGLLLRDSAYKGTLSWETVRRLALDGKGADKLGYRGEFLQLIDKARGLKETRP